MVQEIRMFEADDGKQFVTFDAALTHEHGVKLAQHIIDMLPDNSKLASGDFYQLTREEVQLSRSAFCAALRNKYGSDKTFMKGLDAYEGDPRCDFIGRLLCDFGSPFNKVFHMFASIDYNNNRMFNQPYFANHPAETQKRIPID